MLPGKGEGKEEEEDLDLIAELKEAMQPLEPVSTVTSSPKMTRRASTPPLSWTQWVWKSIIERDYYADATALAVSKGSKLILMPPLAELADFLYLCVEKGASLEEKEVWQQKNTELIKELQLAIEENQKWQALQAGRNNAKVQAAELKSNPLTQTSSSALTWAYNNTNRAQKGLFSQDYFHLFRKKLVAGATLFLLPWPAAAAISLIYSYFDIDSISKDKASLEKQYKKARIALEDLKTENRRLQQAYVELVSKAPKKSLKPS